LEELFWVLVVVTLLLIPFAGVVGAVVSMRLRRRVSVLESRIADQPASASTLAARVAALEARFDQLESVRRGEAPLAPPVASAAPPAIAVETPPIPPHPAPPVEPSAELPPPPPPPPPPRPAAPVPAEPARERPSLEEQFGTRWVVWVGGLALALGGIFMVRYSIEQGWIGPGVRVALGWLLAAALAGAGEWLRRRQPAPDAAGSIANIPSILTAAGTTVAFATVWAAYALYGFLAPGAAFLLLGIVALVALAAAMLHGPALAALGLVGAEVTPLLVSSGKPDYWALYIYLAIVTAAAFALARLRLWRWLAVAALAFGLFWALPDIALAGTAAPHLFHAGRASLSPRC
jgi:uncharacterized membrane protein